MVDSCVVPTKFTYPFVLKACSALQDAENDVKVHGHVKRLDLGCYVYVCTALVDFYMKCGCLEEAMEEFDRMLERDVVSWDTMISGFSLHGLCWDAMRLVLEMQQMGVNPNSSTVVAILPGFKKSPGCSWIEVNGVVHAFVGGDGSHPESGKINKKLEELLAEMKVLGYKPESNFVYQDVEEEEKEKVLLHHSEKLAVAFGIISLKSNKPILVTKNLRICCDCHAALKYITIITKREIIVRDRSRFHHFRNGICSCGEFW